MAIKLEILTENKESLRSINEIKEAVETTMHLMEQVAAGMGKVGEAGAKAAKETEKAVDNVAQPAESAKARLRQLSDEIATLTIEYRNMSASEQQSAKGKALSQKIEKLTGDAATLRDAMDDVNRSVRGVASDTKNWDALAGGINVATSAVGGFTGVAAMLGAKEEELAEIQTKLQASLAISNALSTIQNNLQKESNLMLGIAAIQLKAKAAAEAMATKGTVAATVAQRAFNLVAKANPYVLLATALLSVVGAFYAFSKGASEAKKREEEMAKAAEEAEQKVKDMREAFVNASAESMNMASRISSLQTAYMKANTEFEKTRILKEAAEQFKSLGLECNNLADAQRILVNQGGQVIEMLRLQGTVAALTALRMEAFKRQYQAHLEGGKGVQYSAQLAGMNGEVQALDAQIAQYQSRIGSIQAALPMKRATSSPTPSKTNTGGGGKEMTAAERKAMLERQKKENARDVRELELSTREAQIAAMEEGSEKVVAQIWLDYYKERNAIESSMDELQQKRVEKAKQLWEADKNNKDKDFYASKQYADAFGVVPEVEQQYRAEREDAALVERERRLKEQADAESEAMRKFLKQYGDYQQQRLAITEEYAEKIQQAQTEGEKLMLAKQEDEELRQVDERFGLVTQAMADLFADASRKSVNAIQDIIDKYEALVKYMEGHKGTASKDDLAGLGFSESDIQKILTGEISIKELTDRLKELKGEMKDRSPYQSFIGNMKEAVKLLKEATTKEDKANAFGQMAASVKDFLPALKEFGSDIANIFGQDDSKLSSAIDGLGGMMTAGQGVAQIMSGDIVGGAMAAVKGISQMVDALDGMFGADYSQYQKLVEEYTGLIDVWDTLIEKKKEYISESYGAEAMKAGMEAESLVQRELNAWRELGRERLNAGVSAGSHSIGIRIRKNMSSYDMASASAALGGMSLGGRLEGLFDLTSEQLQRLREQAPTFWAKLDGDVRKYLESIIDGAERLEDIQQQVREQLTNTTFDSVYDSFISSLSDMDKSAYDFSKDFEKYMFDAVLNAQVGKLFKTRLEDWYKAFASANEDGMLSQGEMDALRSEYDRIVKEGIALRDNIAQATGYATSSAEGNATFKSASSFTQEQGDVLNGRLTAIQIGVQNGNVLRQQIANTLATLNGLVGGAGAAIEDMRDLMAVGNTHLEDIVALSKKMLSDFGSNLEKIVNNTNAL